jgi:hypothetical protein
MLWQRTILIISPHQRGKYHLNYYYNNDLNLSLLN